VIWGYFDNAGLGLYNSCFENDDMSHSIAEGLVGIVLIGIATWWVVAPNSYVACIRRVPWLWMSVYPMNAKPWFPRYLRLLGLFFWALFLIGGLCLYRFRLH
jgi:hypothetical protein